jgi:hypothetical protein
MKAGGVLRLQGGRNARRVVFGAPSLRTGLRPVPVASIWCTHFKSMIAFSFMPWEARWMPSIAPRSTATSRIEKAAELTEDRALPLADRLLADPQAQPDLGLRLPPPIESIDEPSIGFN